MESQETLDLKDIEAEVSVKAVTDFILSCEALCKERFLYFLASQEDRAKISELSKHFKCVAASFEVCLLFCQGSQAIREAILRHERHFQMDNGMVGGFLASS